MKKNKLSHSSSNIFMDCPTKWRFHYLERLRPIKTSAALLFGTAIDHAITSLLKNKEKDPQQVFAFFWRFQDINGERTYLPKCVDIVYAKGDFDFDLISDVDCLKINEEFNLDSSRVKIKEKIDQIYERKNKVGFDGLTYEEKLFLNFLNWICLYRKGLLMIEAVKKKVLPRVVEVLSTQEYVSLTNEEGDSVVGYADLVCKYKHDNEISNIIFDFKTSSIEYEPTAVLTSPQLTLYVHALKDKYQTRKAGFIVLNKNIKKNKVKICKQCSYDGSGTRYKTCPSELQNNKRCNGEWVETIDPEIYVQILVNDIPERTDEIVIENLDFINQSIKNGVFHRNLSSCAKPWGPCPFFNKCYYNTDEGLIKLKDK